MKFLNVKKYKLVVSSSHCVAKSVSVGKNAVHICYCYTPMRYLWGFHEEYFGKFPMFLRKFIQFYFNRLKKWDIKTAGRVTAFITSSHYVAERIFNIYGRTAEVINPPAEKVQSAVDARAEQGVYYLIVSALVPYKRIDLAVEAFNRLRQPLKIVGDGPLQEDLKKMVRFEGIQFEGWVEDKKLWNYYQQCKALIFPGEEDFGIVPLEAQMYGKPVLAYGRGGVCETVIPYKEISSEEGKYTGVFFDQPSVDSLVQCIQKSCLLNFDARFIRAHAEQFTKDRFKEKIGASIRNTSRN